MSLGEITPKSGFAVGAEIFHLFLQLGGILSIGTYFKRIKNTLLSSTVKNDLSYMQIRDRCWIKRSIAGFLSAFMVEI